VPVLQLSPSSDTLNEQQLYDYALYRVRQALAPIPGLTLPTPYGGKYRQIMVDIDPAALLAHGLTPTDVTNAVNAQNLTVPAGDAKIGSRQYIVSVNSQPATVEQLNDVPIKQVNGATVYLRDVGHVRDAWAVQQNIVRADGAVQTPERQVSTVNDLLNTSITSASGGAVSPFPNTLGNVASMSRRYIQSVISHNNVAPVYDIYASVSDRDLGSVASDINKVIGELQPRLKPGNTMSLLGQAASMKSAFSRFTICLLFAAVFVYLLMVVNFQDFIDPLAVILGLPGAGCGIIIMLFITGTTLSVPSLMGAIMAIGVASASSILLVTFARERLVQGVPPEQAACEAGRTRLRPVLMTAGAMVVGMLPMAIGGLLVGTLTTLFVVPYVYSAIHGCRIASKEQEGIRKVRPEARRSSPRNSTHDPKRVRPQARPRRASPGSAGLGFRVHRCGCADNIARPRPRSEPKNRKVQAAASAMTVRSAGRAGNPDSRQCRLIPGCCGIYWLRTLSERTAQPSGPTGAGQPQESHPWIAHREGESDRHAERDPSSGNDAGLRRGNNLRPPKRIHLSADRRHRKPGQEQ
jgi:Cu/Ag efflux pump CusA